MEFACLTLMVHHLVKVKETELALLVSSATLELAITLFLLEQLVQLVTPSLNVDLWQLAFKMLQLAASTAPECTLFQMEFKSQAIPLQFSASQITLQLTKETPTACLDPCPCTIPLKDSPQLELIAHSSHT